MLSNPIQRDNLSICSIEKGPQDERCQDSSHLSPSTSSSSSPSSQKNQNHLHRVPASPRFARRGGVPQTPPTAREPNHGNHHIIIIIFFFFFFFFLVIVVVIAIIIIFFFIIIIFFININIIVSSRGPLSRENIGRCQIIHQHSGWVAEIINNWGISLH